MNYVWGLNLEPTRKLVLLKLADNYNDCSGRCNPSVSHIAKVCCVSERTVFRHLSALRDLGVITWEQKIGSQGQENNEYTLCHFVTPSLSPVSPAPLSSVSVPQTFINNNNHSAFDAFWSAYPKKVNKQKAKVKFLKLPSLLQEKATADVSARAGSDRQWLAGYVPDPTTYLNGHRWEDEWERAEGSKQMVHGVDYV